MLPETPQTILPEALQITPHITTKLPKRKPSRVKKLDGIDHQDPKNWKIRDRVKYREAFYKGRISHVRALPLRKVEGQKDPVPSVYIDDEVYTFQRASEKFEWIPPTEAKDKEQPEHSEDDAMSSVGFRKTDRSFAEWVRKLSQQRLSRPDRKQVRRFNKIVNSVPMKDIGSREIFFMQSANERVAVPYGKTTVDDRHPVLRKWKLFKLYLFSSDGSKAWKKLVDMYHQLSIETRDHMFDTIPYKLKDMLVKSNFKYLSPKLAATVLDRVRLYHFSPGVTLPYTLMSLRPDLSYYREYWENGNRISKVIFFSRSRERAFSDSVMEITELFFVNGEYFAYGNAQLIGNDLGSGERNKLDELRLLFHVFQGNRQKGLSSRIFTERMRELSPLLPEDGHFKVLDNQFDKDVSALPFYAKLGFKPKNTKYEEVMKDYLSLGRIDPGEFPKLVRSEKYRVLFASSLVRPVIGFNINRAMHSIGFTKTDRPFAQWVQDLAGHQLSEPDQRQLDRLNELFYRRPENVTHKELFFREQVNEVDALPYKEIDRRSNNEAEAWGDLVSTYKGISADTRKTMYAGIPDKLNEMLQEKEYKYLSPGLAETILDRVRLHHYNFETTTPFSLMSLRSNLSYYREYEAPNASKIAKVIFFTQSLESRLEITEFFFRDGEYIGYGHAALMSSNRAFWKKNKLDNVVLLFHIFERSRTKDGLSARIFEERLKEFSALLPEDGQFVILGNQLRQEPSALPFYVKMGFIPEDPGLERSMAGYLAELSDKRNDPDAFNNLKKRKEYREFFFDGFKLERSVDHAMRSSVRKNLRQIWDRVKPSAYQTLVARSLHESQYFGHSETLLENFGHKFGRADIESFAQSLEPLIHLKVGDEIWQAFQQQNQDTLHWIAPIVRQAAVTATSLDVPSFMNYPDRGVEQWGEPFNKIFRVLIRDKLARQDYHLRIKDVGASFGGDILSVRKALYKGLASYAREVLRMPENQIIWWIRQKWHVTVEAFDVRLEPLVTVRSQLSRQDNWIEVKPVYIDLTDATETSLLYEKPAEIVYATNVFEIIKDDDHQIRERVTKALNNKGFNPVYPGIFITTSDVEAYEVKEIMPSASLAANAAMTAFGFAPTPLPFVDWVQHLSEHQLTTRDKVQLDRLARISKKQDIGALTEWEKNYREQAEENEKLGIHGIPDGLKIQRNSVGQEALENLSRAYENIGASQGLPLLSMFPGFLRGMLDHNGYTYLSSSVASEILDRLRLYTFHNEAYIPYSLMLIRPYLSYYREYVDEGGSRVAKVIFFTVSKESVFEMTEFYFVNGEYFGYGHARLINHDQGSWEDNKFDTVQMLYHVLDGSRRNNGLSRRVFETSLKELKAFSGLLAENGEFEVLGNQFDQDVRALPFYLRMGFRFQDQKIEYLAAAYLTAVRENPEEFPKLVKIKAYKDLFTSRLVKPFTEVATVSAAQLTSKIPGGIDLTARHMKLEVDSDKASVSQPMDLKALDNIEINGLYIKDIEVKPLKNLPELLGVSSR